MKIKLNTLRKLIREEFEADLPPIDTIPSGRDLDYQVPAEGKHAKNHLFHTSKDAIELHDILEDEDNIPAWCLEYIAIARHEID